MTTESTTPHNNGTTEALSPKRHSPVASLSKPKKTLLKWALMGMGALLVYAMMASGHKPMAKPEAAPAAPTVAPLQAPQLALNNQQIANLKQALGDRPFPPPKAEDRTVAELEAKRILAPVITYSAQGSEANVGGVATHLTDNHSSDNAVLGGDGTGDSNTQWMSHLSQSKAPQAQATHLAHPATTLAQGTLIWATLESRINSDLPGMVRAVTSQDIYSEDDAQVLLPKGTRLIGQYNSAIAQGQNRVFVVWQRAIRPDHIDIALASPGTDPLGTAGMGANSIDHHFIEQFGTAALLSLMGAGAANVGVNPADQFNSAAAYRQALADSFTKSAQNALQMTGVIKPTLIVNQGDKISVFVARDLDFYDELARATATAF